MRVRLCVNILVWIGIAALVAGGISMQSGASSGHEAAYATTAGAPSGMSHEDLHKRPCPFCRLVSALVLPGPVDLPRFIAFPLELRYAHVDLSHRTDRRIARPVGARAPPRA